MNLNYFTLKDYLHVNVLTETTITALGGRKVASPTLGRLSLVPILQEDECTRGPIWKRRSEDKSTSLEHQVWNRGRPARTPESCRLSYRAHTLKNVTFYNLLQDSVQGYSKSLLNFGTRQCINKIMYSRKALIRRKEISRKFRSELTGWSIRPHNEANINPVINILTHNVPISHGRYKRLHTRYFHADILITWDKWAPAH